MINTKMLFISILLGTAHVQSAESKTLNVALNQDIRGINPGVNRDASTDSVLENIVEGLVGYAEDGEVKPVLARSIDVSMDGKTYTFKLRKNVHFHNGDLMTSADVVWSWDRFMNPKTGWRCLPDFDGRNGPKVESISAPDSGTVVMRLNHRFPLFLDNLARDDCAMAAVMSPSSVDKDGSWSRPIGTGPFKFSEWRPGEYISLTKFNDYQSPGTTPDGIVGLKQPLVDEVRYIDTPDPAAVKAGLLSGKIDLARVLDSDMADLTSEGIKLDIEATTIRNTLIFQTKDKTLGNRNFREAIATALDMPNLVGAATNGTAKPNPSLIIAKSIYHDDIQSQGYQFDVQRAKQLLISSGYSGETLTITTARRADLGLYPLAIITQSMLHEIGVKTRLQVLDWGALIDRYLKGNYQIMTFAYSGRTDPWFAYDQLLGDKEKQPRKIWKNASASALLKKAGESNDKAVRQVAFDQLHKLMLKDVPGIMINNEAEVLAHRPQIHGVKPWVLGKVRVWNVSKQ